MKTCITCKHCILNHTNPDDSRCTLIARQNPITGELRSALCDMTRWTGALCGPDGEKWEARELIAAE